MMAAFGGKASGISKAEYLKRYLDGCSSGGEDGAAKKKKRRKKKLEGKGMRIVDDDAEDWKEETKTKEEVVEEEEDQPVVAEFVDERPEEVKRMEEFRNTNKWRRIQDDGSPEADRSPASESRTNLDESMKESLNRTDYNSVPPDASAACKVRHDSPDPSSPQRSRHDSLDFFPSQKRRHDSPDSSPTQKGRHDSPDSSSPQKGRHDSPDFSPPRKGRHDSPDSSPPGKGRHGSPDLPPKQKGRSGSNDLSPPRKGRLGSPDLSPPRKGRRGSPDLSPPRKGRRGSPDLSPPRKGRRGSPDLSPPRKGRLGSPNTFPPKKHQQDGLRCSPSRVLTKDYQKNSSLRHNRYCSPDSSAKHWGKNQVNSVSGSASYPHSKKKHSPSPSSTKNRQESWLQKNRMRSSDSSPKDGADRSLPYGRSSPHSSTRHNSDSDLSPPRKMEKRPTQDRQRKVRQRDSDSDLSPPRHAEQRGSDSDLSPPRRADCRDPDSLPLRSRAESERGSSYSQRSGGSTMLSGGRVGLISAEVLKEEKEEERRTRKDNKNLEQDSRNAETIFRDKSGKRRDLKTEREEQLQKQAAQEKRDQKYAQWGKGLAQQKQQRQNVEDAAREMSKPLARYIDDTDLDRLLREQERDGDPMAKFLKKKNEEQGKKKERPRYKGPNPPLNRFNIWPGYRWDGVDRSNGFENKYFARISEKKAVQESAYKWSVEDM